MSDSDSDSDSELPPKTDPNPGYIPLDASVDPGIEAFRQVVQEVMQAELAPLKASIEDLRAAVDKSSEDRQEDHKKVNKLWEERRDGPNGAPG